MTHILFALAISTANANWFAALCDRALYSMSTPDPDQFTNTSTDWLIAELRRISVRTKWNKPVQDDQVISRIIRQTLETRMLYLSDAAEVEKILSALKE